VSRRHDRLFAVCALTVVFLRAGPEAIASDSRTPALLSPAQLSQDLSFIQDTLVGTHPDINLSADAIELKATFNRIEREVSPTLDKGSSLEKVRATEFRVWRCPR